GTCSASSQTGTFCLSMVFLLIPSNSELTSVPANPKAGCSTSAEISHKLSTSTRPTQKLLREEIFGYLAASIGYQDAICSSTTITGEKAVGVSVTALNRQMKNASTAERWRRLLYGDSRFLSSVSWRRLSRRSRGLARLDGHGVETYTYLRNRQ